MAKGMKVVENMIYVLRGHRVMLDSDLAVLYGVETRALNQAVKRNIDRFPKDFMFQLSSEEAMASRSQSVILNRGQNIKFLPYVFTEHGALMLANVLRSERAIKVSIEVVRTFVRLRQAANQQEEMARNIRALAEKYSDHDEKIKAIFDALGQMMANEEKPKPRIGFGRGNEERSVKARKRH